MRLSRMIKKELVKLELCAKNKEELIKEMVELISKDKRIKDKKEVLKAITNRELIKSTGVGNGVAIPHTRTDAAEDIVVAFARSTEGIDFDAVDKKPVMLFFMVVGPKRKNDEYLRVMSMIAKLISKDENRKLLRDALTQTELIKSIETIEEKEFEGAKL